MTIDLDHLEEAAKAATRGPWLERYEDVYSEVDAHVAFCLTVCSSASECCITKKQAQANAAFIATANPAVVLELVAELRKARAERNWLAKRIALDGVSCPIEPNVCAGTCEDHIQCWLEAARKAVEKEGKE